MRARQRLIVAGMFIGVAGALSISVATADTIVAPSTRIDLTMGLMPSSDAPPAGTDDRAAGAAGTEAAPSASNAAALAKKLNNPISDLISVPFQFNYDTGYGPKDGGRVTVNIQPVIPFSISKDWNLISRTILPVIYQDSIADGVSSAFGFGDATQSLFLSPKEPVGGWIIGAGPVALLPTGTSPLFRTENFGLGPTAVVLRQERGWTYGALANQIWSVAKSSDASTVNSMYLQPFIAHTWPTATTLTLNTESTYNWTESEWTIPINLMLSQVLKLGDQPVSLQIGGRWYAESPNGGPEWGLRFMFTLLFPK